MEIKESVALVTGANRGIGRAFVRALVDHGAAKVYAGARDPATVADPDVTPLQLDVTSPAEIAAAAAVADDVTIVINNAGVFGSDTKLLAGSLDDAHQEMEVNYFGAWEVSRVFAPILGQNGGGALVNMLSVASWVGRPEFPGYAASKAAQWSLTQSLREGLRDQGTLVIGVHAGFVETDLSAWTDAPKIGAASVAEQTMQALANNSTEVLADERTRQVKAALAKPAGESRLARIKREQ
ncbi:MAG TPA: SDR family oxidoreductase [Steroidobacteraceae bacterium]|nr:SDR family oxidoreductase [Steroidobacteraceae bacterium]